ncbi:MAG: PorV/PorQ family protein [Gemmatimonadota bacterium]
MDRRARRSRLVPFRILSAAGTLLVLCSLLLASFSPAWAQEEDVSSTEGALFLLLPVGARAVSLGRAMTALEGGESVFWNPAGLATLAPSRLMLIRGDHAVGEATSVSLLSAHPGLGTLAASYFLLDVGDQDLTDDQGNVLGTVTVRNHLGVVSAATELVDGLNVGANFKIVRFQLSCRGLCPDAGTTATTYAVDVGVQYTPSPAAPLRLGAMVAHVGPRLQVLNAEQADPLPSRVRIAAAYDVIRGLLGRKDLGAWIAVEVQDRLREPGSLSLYLGSEFRAGDDGQLFLRAGYVVGDIDQEEGARVGLGLQYERFELSIAKSLAVSTLTGETEPVHVTFSILF